MKILIYIQFLSLFFLYPHHTLATNKGQGSFRNSFQKNQQFDQVISDDLQIANDFFDDELSDNNDNDPISARKKISFRDLTCSYTTSSNVPDFFNTMHDKFYCYPDNYSPAVSDFISFRVLRL